MDWMNSYGAVNTLKYVKKIKGAADKNGAKNGSLKSNTPVFRTCSPDLFGITRVGGHGVC